MNKNKIALIANSSWYIYNFRLNLIDSLSNSYDEIMCVAPRDDYSEKLKNKNLSFHHLNLVSTSQNIFKELLSLYSLYKIVKKNKIKVLLSFTPKVNLYSCLVSRVLNVKIINNISGLGIKFRSNSIVYRIIFFSFNRLLKYSDFVFFQNKDDLLTIAESRNCKNFINIPGSGVDINKFSFDQNPLKKKYNFSLISRLIKEKGIYDYIEAIKLVKSEIPKINCAITGFIYSDRKNSIKYSELMEWVNMGIISYLGHTDNVKKIISQSECIVLPSYYNEGVPRILLEASAVGRPIITTNNIGCTEAIIDGVTGFLCEKRNPKDLANKMIKFVKMGQEQKNMMGRKGSEKMKNEFDERIVIRTYLDALKELL